jgi:hypothetical protein
VVFRNVTEEQHVYGPNFHRRARGRLLSMRRQCGQGRGDEANARIGW